MNKKVLLGALSAIVIAGTGTAASAFADTNSTTSQQVSHQGHQWHNRQQGGGQLNEIAKVLGIDVHTLQSDLQSGQSIADVAQSKGIDEQTLISDLKSQLQSRLDQAVKNGKLTADKEQQMISNATARLQKFVEHKGSFAQGEHQRGNGGGQLNEIAKVLGIDVHTLQSDLQSGQSIADVAQSKGMDEQTLISDLKSQMQSRLDQAVKNGKLTADKEQQMLSNFATNAKKFLEHKGAFTHQHEENQQSQTNQQTANQQN